MHIQRNHCETITCGMCDYEAKDFENLDIHTFTCEMYKCNEMEFEKKLPYPILNASPSIKNVLMKLSILQIICSETRKTRIELIVKVKMKIKNIQLLYCV